MTVSVLKAFPCLHEAAPPDLTRKRHLFCQSAGACT